VQKPASGSDARRAHDRIEVSNLEKAQENTRLRARSVSVTKGPRFFPAAPASGHTLLPAPVGPVSRCNADGRLIVNRDEPKEERYSRTVFWRWKQWAGRDQIEDGKNVATSTAIATRAAWCCPCGIEVSYRSAIYRRSDTALPGAGLEARQGRGCPHSRATLLWR